MVTGFCQRSLGAALALSAIVFAAPPGAWAQTGSITGKVTDQSGGAPLEAARVLITEQPDRDHRAGGAVHLSQRRAGKLSVPGTPARIPAGHRQRGV